MAKKILIIGFLDSIHTARWVSQLEGQGWDIHLFPSIRGESVHPSMANVTVYHFFHSERLSPERDLNQVAESQFAIWADRFRTHVFDKHFPMYRAKQLKRVIGRLKPDVIHSLEIQTAGYLALETKKLFGGEFPRWLVTNWGSDIYLFGRLHNHRQKIGEVLANCDYYSCECERDAKLAREFGFEKKILPVFPNAGGFDLAILKEQRNQIDPSDRRLIMLKGYQHWAGRALAGLRALERCADLLSGYEIVIYSAMPDVALAAELFSEKTGIPVRVPPQKLPHKEIMALHARARISIGLSISDAISTSLLEAMVMGSFPIQSCTACAEEWIEHGVSGMIVPPEDPDIIEMAIRAALSDDKLVDQAALINWRTAEDRLDATRLRQKAINLYETVWE